ncbi:uncharacterized protein LY79DRAFT_167087 [Colletotrichum navitas]|uniref:Uncharacterized protein n=1 Tax=Colletotrichum navitas TaxID=681940 RepID=A0AAD8V646_9PEZI|nr:uncharacterized protein LY79DRAFT_167087 [Colletotrichum navitas]KAK1594018.1 hypothetical protein LY79DRAFT_167087 [Colletotrichum navitas]
MPSTMQQKVSGIRDVYSGPRQPGSFRACIPKPEENKELTWQATQYDVISHARDAHLPWVGRYHLCPKILDCGWRQRRENDTGDELVLKIGTRLEGSVVTTARPSSPPPSTAASRSLSKITMRVTVGGRTMWDGHQNPATILELHASEDSRKECVEPATLDDRFSETRRGIAHEMKRSAWKERERIDRESDAGFLETRPSVLLGRVSEARRFSSSTIEAPRDSLRPKHPLKHEFRRRFLINLHPLPFSRFDYRPGFARSILENSNISSPPQATSL